MNPDPKQFLDHLEAFLLGGVDDPLDDLKTELAAEGVDLLAFLQRIEQAPTDAKKAEKFSLSGRGKARAKDDQLFFMELPTDSDERRCYSRFPIHEMMRRGWVDGSLGSIRDLFACVPDSSWTSVLCRKTESVRSKHRMDHNSLIAWTARVIARTQANIHLPRYRQGSVTMDLMRHVVLKSTERNGPAAACSFLAAHGIPVIVEPHLPMTYLDGAAIMVLNERPIIGLTVRHDRLDNFWFTLMHELAHLHLHSSLGPVEFFDDMDYRATKDSREAEADALAAEVLVPDKVWRASPASRSRMPQAIASLAKKLRIHPAIVAGRMHHESKSYGFAEHVGHHAVRCEFPDVIWPA